METAKEVLEQYKHADMGRRLNMYVQYRDYRGEFLLIDREDNNTQKVETPICCGQKQKIVKEVQTSPLRKFLHVFACR